MISAAHLFIISQFFVEYIGKYLNYHILYKIYLLLIFERIHHLLYLIIPTMLGALQIIQKLIARNRERISGFIQQMAGPIWFFESHQYICLQYVCVSLNDVKGAKQALSRIFVDKWIGCLPKHWWFFSMSEI